MKSEVKNIFYPLALREAIEKKAKENGRSAKQEINHALIKAYKPKAK